MIRFLFLISLLILPLNASGAAAKFRPYTGEGVLAIMPFVPETTEAATIFLYRTPGVGRIREASPGDFPGLSGVVPVSSGVFPLAVMAQRGNWVKVAYDDAGQEGWLEAKRYWSYTPWDRFLKGRTAHLLPGLQKRYYSVRRDRDPRALEISPVTPKLNLSIVDCEGDWALVNVDPTVTGWIRWRDEDGRFLISLDQAMAP